MSDAPCRGLVREGICGMCETGVLDDTPEHRDYVLARQERLDGENMMICCSRNLRLVRVLCWSAPGVIVMSAQVDTTCQVRHPSVCIGIVRDMTCPNPKRSSR
jgi:hypothetical protein